MRPLFFLQGPGLKQEALHYTEGKGRESVTRVLTVPHGRLQHNVCRVAKVTGVCRKINYFHDKKEFFANYISIYKNVE